MALKFSQADRNYMRAFTIGIAFLGVVTLIDMAIATWVWSSQPKPNEAQVTAFAAGTPTLMGITKTQSSEGAAKASATTGTKASTPPSSSQAPAATASSSTATAATAATASYQYDAAKGKSLFDGTCAACHQANGKGIPGVFPPLAGNEAVNDSDPATQVQTILEGRHGTVINGQKYSGVMPPFGSQFSDVQIADIANFERSSWGNQAKHITPKDVAAIRAKAK